MPDTGNHTLLTAPDIDPMRSVIIAGASLAGVRTADALRAGGFEGAISLVGAERDLPYDRPPLSKQFLAGQFDEERLLLRSAESYENDRIDLHLGVRATKVDVDGRRIKIDLDNDETIEAEALVIATGTKPRPLTFPVEHPNVFSLRTRQDCEQIRALLLAGTRIVVIGAGFIGAEVASTARNLGCSVTVLETAPVPLARQLGTEMGLACAELHLKNEVDLQLGVDVDRIERDRVHLCDGRTFAADVVVTGVGVQPCTEWLSGDSFDIADGVCSDATLRVRRAGSPDVFENVVAVGDIVRFPNELFDEVMRVEHWTNAVESASHAAATLLGAREPFTPVPYFWSDQFGKKIQFLGRSTGFEEVRVVEGSLAEGAWLALYRRNDRLIGALAVSKIRSLMKLRPLLSQRASWAEGLEAVTS